MGLSTRERKVLTDIEQTLEHDDPRLARQLSHMVLKPPPERKAGDRFGEEEPGRRARRVARWCAALALVLVVLSDLVASTALLYGAAIAALASGVGLVATRKARHHRRAPGR